MPATRSSRRCRIHAIPCGLIEPSRPCTGCRPTHLKNSRDREWPWKLIERDCVSHRPSHYLADPGSPGSGPFLCRPAGRANGEKVANRSVPTALSELPTSLRRLCQFKTRAAPLRPVPSDVASAAMRSLCGFAFVLRFAQPCTGLPLRGCISDSFASWGSTRSQLAARSTNRTIWPRSAVFDSFRALSSSKPREFKSCDRVGNPLSSSLRTFWRAIFRRGSGPGPTRAPTLITDHATFLINQGTSVGCGCLRSTINLGRRRYHHYSCEESRERLLGRDGNASDICREFKASAKWDNHGGREATKPKSNLSISRGGTQSFTLLLWHRQ
jgi:hypothetical protein